MFTASATVTPVTSVVNYGNGWAGITLPVFMAPDTDARDVAAAVWRLARIHDVTVCDVAVADGMITVDISARSADRFAAILVDASI